MNRNTLSPRDYLGFAGVGLGASALTCTGLMALGGRASAKPLSDREGEGSVSDRQDLTPIVIDFPLRGEWVAYQTPGERIPSHGTDQLGERYAYDFIRIDRERDGWQFIRASMWHYYLVGVELDDCFAWAEPIYAPFAGTVVGAQDGWPERSRVRFLGELAASLVNSARLESRATQDVRSLLGNHIVLKMPGKEVCALIAHARTGSLQVREGDAVLTGQHLADVGHSGNSMAPHLHFQLMDSSDVFQANGLPCSFREYEALRDGEWMRVVAGIPGRREFIRHAAYRVAPARSASAY